MFHRKNNISSEINWLKDHTYSIQLHELDDHSDLYFLKPLLHEHFAKLDFLDKSIKNKALDK